MTETVANRKNVLVSAYACNPESSLQLHPGEDILGWNLVRQLHRFHNLTIITHTYNRKGIQEAKSRQEIAGARFLFLDLGPRIWRLYRSEIGQRIYYYAWQRAAYALARQLHRRTPFDLAHHITFNNDWIPSLIGAYLPVPFILGPVGGGQRTPKLFYREFSMREKKEEVVRLCGQWIGRHILPARHRMLKRAGAVLVCNRETKMQMPKRFASKIEIFPVTGISRTVLENRPNVQKNDTFFSIISAGRLVHWKNYSLALRAFARLSIDAADSRLTIIGEGPEKNRLIREAKRMGIEERVRFYPWMPQKELFQAMTSSDVFLYPSLREGGGAVVIEAMACGLPIICLDTAGPAVNVGSHCGIKIKPNSPDQVEMDMAKSLHSFLREPEKRRQMGIAARRHVETHFLWDVLGERLQRIYHLVLSSRPVSEA